MSLASPPPDRRNGSQLPFSEQEIEKLAESSEEELTALANSGHRKILSSMRQVVRDDARLSGAALLEMKVRTGHGSWTEWLRRNFEGSVETARVYMRIAKNWLSIVEHLGENATLEEMRSFLSLPKEQGRPKLDIEDDCTEEPIAPTPPRPQAVETIEIFLDADDGEFKEMVSYLMEEVFQAENVSDTIRRAIEFCYEEKYHDENNPSRKHAV